MLVNNGLRKGILVHKSDISSVLKCAS